MKYTNHEERREAARDTERSKQSRGMKNGVKVR